MKRILLLATVAACVAIAYAAWPLIAAFQIKQAVRAGDLEALQRKIHWQPVRDSLKASIATLPPEPAAAEETTSAALWTRVKSVAEPVLADRMIDHYFSPEGLLKLDRARHGMFMSMLGFGKTKGGAADGQSDEAEQGLVRRFVNFYGKIVHARFQSLSEVEFEIAERPNSPRHLIAQFVLSGFDWKLAALRVVSGR